MAGYYLARREIHALSHPSALHSGPPACQTGGDRIFGILEALTQQVRPERFVEPESLQTRLAQVRSVFDRDMARVAEVSELLCGPEIAAYGARATAVFMRWEQEGGGPTLPALAAYAARHFEIDTDSPGFRSLMMAGVLAELPNTLQYHGNEHYRKVLFHAIRLAATHNLIYADRPERFLTGSDVVVLMTAACIHDLGHEGGDNLRDGVYTPGQMEQIAIDIARPYLEAAGLDRDMMGMIETIVFCTDITFFAGDNSPCIRMKKIYKHYLWNDDSEDVSMMTMGKLRRYEDNPRLVEMAMMLHEADIGSSAGLSYEQTIRETINIMEERGAKTAGPKTVLAFLREQLGETLFTDAARQVLGPVMATVIEQAEHDIISGRKTFYDPV